MSTPLITGEILKKVVPNIDIKRAVVIADRIDFLAHGYKMDDPDILQEFVAQCAHESWSFRARAESLTYSAKRILDTWPSRFKTLAEAQPYANNPKALADKVYNGRMGNKVGTDDGWLFRGAGFIQLTGRDITTSYTKWLGSEDKPEVVAQRIRTDDYYAMDSAMWVFAISKGLRDEAINDEFLKITKAINGGTIGLAEREKFYERAKMYIK